MGEVPRLRRGNDPTVDRATVVSTTGGNFPALVPSRVPTGTVGDREMANRGHSRLGEGALRSADRATHESTLLRTDHGWRHSHLSSL